MTTKRGGKHILKSKTSTNREARKQPLSIPPVQCDQVNDEATQENVPRYPQAFIDAWAAVFIDVYDKLKERGELPDDDEHAFGDETPDQRPCTSFCDDDPCCGASDLEDGGLPEDVAKAWASVVMDVCEKDEAEARKAAASQQPCRDRYDDRQSMPVTTKSRTRASRLPNPNAKPAPTARAEQLTTESNVRIGDFEFSVRYATPSPEARERWTNRVEILSRWLLHEWEEEQSQVRAGTSSESDGSDDLLVNVSAESVGSQSIEPKKDRKSQATNTNQAQACRLKKET